MESSRGDKGLDILIYTLGLPITGENPVPPEAAGKVRQMADAWVEWGKLQGLIS